VNYLAHLFFADASPQSIIGNLAADSLKGDPEHHGVLAEAIRLHRRVDAFTDSNPVVTRSCRRLDPPFRHTSRIIVDVFHDHFLACHWTRFADEPLDRFCARVYDVLRANRELLPQEVRGRFIRMTEEDWLCGYVDIESVRLALTGLSRRLKRPVRLQDAMGILREHYSELEADFLEFFPELVAMVRSRAGSR
jgi:acyl carrier protein phosphodiesterase